MSTHIHECTRGPDDYYCASRGYCECECGAWQGEADEEWSAPVRESLPRFTQVDGKPLIIQRTGPKSLGGAA